MPQLWRLRDIGGSNRNLLDFNDLHIDRQGRVYVAFADGCTGDCATNPNATASDSRDGRGAVYYLADGPSLYLADGELMRSTDSCCCDCSRVTYLQRLHDVFEFQSRLCDANLALFDACLVFSSGEFPSIF